MPWLYSFKGPNRFRNSYDDTKGTGLSLLDLIEMSYGKKSVTFNSLDNAKILFYLMISICSCFGLSLLSLIIVYATSSSNDNDLPEIQLTNYQNY